MVDRGNRGLVLSFFLRADAPVLAALDSDPEHRRRFDFPTNFVPSVQHSEEVIARWKGERSAGTRFPFAVRDADTGQLVGGCELMPVQEGTANVSYWTLPRYRQCGIASEALRQVCIVAFAELGFRRIELIVDSDNAPSRRVAIRNGFSEQGQRDGRMVYLREAGE